MGPPGGGRNDITGRFTRHMNIISIDEFDDATMTRIFNSITDWHFAKGFEAAFVRNGKVGYLTLTMSLGSLISTIKLYFVEVSIQFGILL